MAAVDGIAGADGMLGMLGAETGGMALVPGSGVLMGPPEVGAGTAVPAAAGVGGGAVPKFVAGVVGAVDVRIGDVGGGAAPKFVGEVSGGAALGLSGDVAEGVLGGGDAGGVKPRFDVDSLGGEVGMSAGEIRLSNG